MFKHKLLYATKELHCASLFILYFLVHNQKPTDKLHRSHSCLGFLNALGSHCQSHPNPGRRLEVPPGHRRQKGPAPDAKPLCVLHFTWESSQRQEVIRQKKNHPPRSHLKRKNIIDTISRTRCFKDVQMLQTLMEKKHFQGCRSAKLHLQGVTVHTGPFSRPYICRAER